MNEVCNCKVCQDIKENYDSQVVPTYYVGGGGAILLDDDTL